MDLWNRLKEKPECYTHSGLCEEQIGTKAHDLIDINSLWIPFEELMGRTLITEDKLEEESLYVFYLV